MIGLVQLGRILPINPTLNRAFKIAGCVGDRKAVRFGVAVDIEFNLQAGHVSLIGLVHRAAEGWVIDGRLRAEIDCQVVVVVRQI